MSDCGLYVLPKRPWENVLDWGLQVTPVGDPFATFANFVKQEKTETNFSSFPQFKNLPQELQHMVIRMLDMPTLWNFMRASPDLRGEANKVFWSNSDVHYRVIGSWLLCSGTPCDTPDDLDFLASSRRILVEIVWPRFKQRMIDHKLTPRNTKTNESAPDLRPACRVLWQTFQQHAPRATHVVLNITFAGATGPVLPAELKTIADMSPHGLTVSISITSGDATNRHHLPLKRSLWQPSGPQTGGHTGTWKMVDSFWTPIHVCPPPKSFRGPAGKLMHLLLYHHRFKSRKAAALLLLYQAIEKHYFCGRRESFVCPRLGCTAIFQQPGEWTFHAIRTGHGASAAPPDPLKAAFHEHHKMLDEEYHRAVVEIKAELKSQWGKEPLSLQRRHLKEELLQQLRDDPIHAQKRRVVQSSVWKFFCAMIEGEFDL